jgi:DNA repair protein RadC
MKITSSLIAYNHLRRVIGFESEETWAIYLRSNLTTIKTSCLFKGTADSCLIHPRDIFRMGYINNAVSIIISHSHPSLDPRPSDSDINITLQLVKIGSFLQMPIVDHLIMTPKEFSSMADLGIIESKPSRSSDDISTFLNSPFQQI